MPCAGSRYVSPGRHGSALLGPVSSRIPRRGVDALEQKLREANVEFEFHRYDAKHAFANETADTKNLPAIEHSPEPARQAWERTLSFLGSHLR